MTTDRDLVVARALAGVDVPDHAPGFWDGLEQRLAAMPDGTTHPMATPGAPVEEAAIVSGPPRPRVRRAHLVAAAAVVLVVVAAAALVARTDTVRVPVDDATTSTPTSAPASVPGSDAAVLAFLDALGTGDIDAAASRVGIRSEAALEAAGTSVEAFLRQAEEGFGAWAHAPDRTTRVVELRPGEVVVVVSGTLRVEGNVEQRDDAFPARYAESAQAWFVERWAYDLSTGIPVEIEVTGRTVEAQVPGDGTAWLSVDGARPQDVTVPAGRTATWTLPADLGPGPHLYVVAFVSETTFAATAKTVS